MSTDVRCEALSDSQGQKFLVFYQKGNLGVPLLIITPNDLDMILRTQEYELDEMELNK